MCLLNLKNKKRRERYATRDAGGGAGGNRSRVRKPIRMVFYERIPSLGFPSRAADRKAARYGSRVSS